MADQIVAADPFNGKIDTVILAQEHPEIKKAKNEWERVRILVEEDEEKYLDKEIFMDLPNEDSTQKKKREAPFLMGFFNPSKDLIAAKGEYILRRQVVRNTKNEELKKFIDRTDQSGQSMNDFIKNQVSPNLQAYATVFGVVDKPRKKAASKAEELQSGMPYMYILHISQVKNWAWGSDGSLEWFRYTQCDVENTSNPFPKTSDAKTYFVTWTRHKYYRHDEEGNFVESFDHGFQRVPVAIQSSFVVDPRKTLGTTTFFSSSRHLIMGNNHLSIANFEVMKYGTVLIMDQSDWNPNFIDRKKDTNTNLTKLEAKSAEGSVLPVNDIQHPPKYLEKNIEIIGRANDQASMYFKMAAESEASGQTAMPLSGEPASPGNPKSGIAMAYDFQDMDANLFSHAKDLEAFEKQVFAIVSAELNISNPDISVQYPSNFDVRSFEDKINLCLGLDKIGFASETGKKLAQKQIVPDLTQDPTEQVKIEREIDNANLEPAAAANAATDPNADPNNTPQ